ncbi:hypothetical protein [Ensifer sp. 4252]|uniref:hypothetical protein n=1 Tax=Ensifer sp. 4252 TaxID=3373915 RepID=UPI003D202FBB
MSKTLGSRNEIILPDEFAQIESVFHELLEEWDVSPEANKPTSSPPASLVSTKAEFTISGHSN